MHSKATLQLGGNVGATLIDLGTGTREHWRTENTMTSGGLSLIRDYLLASEPSAAPAPPSYIAVGSGTDVPSRFMTQVPGEFFRTAIVQRDPDGQGVIFHGFFDPFDARHSGPGAPPTLDLSPTVAQPSGIGMPVGSWGLYAGDATDEVGTGTLIAVARPDTPFNKNPTNTLSLDWTVTASGCLGNAQAGVTTSGMLSLIRDYLMASRAEDAPRPPSYLAVGSGTVGPGRYMTAVPSELFRIPIVWREQVDTNANAPAVTYHGYIPPSAHNVRFAGYGIYAGDASDALGTGVLVAVASGIGPFTKSSSMSRKLDWTVTVSGKL